MNITKLTANIELPGSVMFGKEACQKSPKELTEYNCLIVTDKIRKRKKLEYKKEKLVFFTRKCVPALQVINMSEEAYQYMISSEVPSFSNRSTWMKMSKEQRLVAHLNETAASLGGKLVSYYVYPD